MGATARAARGRRAGNRLPSRRHTTTVNTDGYDISEVRGHLRFILSFVLPNFALPSFDVPPSTLPFISIRFFCRSCSLIISFCSSPAHVTLSLSLFPLLPRPCLARRFYFSLSNPVSPVPPPKGGSSSLHARAFISRRPSCRPFFVRGSSFTCCSRVILQIERSVQIDFVPGYKIVLRFLIPPLALSLWRSRKKFEKSALLEIADQLFENSFRWPGRFNNH